MTSIRDIIIIAVILFAVGITTIFSVKIGHDVNTNLLSINAINSTPEAEAVIESADTAINMTDYIFLAFFIGFFISIIIFGWIVGGQPILAPIYFFILVIFTFVAVILQEVYKDIALNPQILGGVANMPITNFILANLGMFMAIFGLIGIVIMYAKPEANNGSIY
jgi:hypothetical protein